MSASSISFFEQVGRNFDRAAKLTAHDPTLLAQIKECNRAGLVPVLGEPVDVDAGVGHDRADVLGHGDHLRSAIGEELRRVESDVAEALDDDALASDAHVQAEADPALRRQLVMAVLGPPCVDDLDRSIVAPQREGHVVDASVLGFAGAKDLQPTQAALELDCDILIPAALENVVTGENAPRIRARIVAEAANGPLTADASELLSGRGVIVIPDTDLNAGGVTMSYFEWLKDLEHVRFGRMEKRFEEHAFRRLLSAVESATERKFSQDMLATLAQGADERDLVYSGLEETMCQAHRELREIQQRHDGKIDLRTASFIDAIDKIAAAYSNMGIFP